MPNRPCHPWLARPRLRFPHRIWTVVTPRYVVRRTWNRSRVQPPRGSISATSAGWRHRAGLVTPATGSARRRCTRRTGRCGSSSRATGAEAYGLRASIRFGRTVERLVLAGEHHQRAAVELAGALGTVDELPQPLQGVLGLAVGHLLLARLPALERRHGRGAVLVEHQADAVGPDRARDVVAGAEVIRRVGPSSP
jgi:hypothetical protein